MIPNPLESTYRPIRRIAPPDVPIAGVLAAEGDNTVLLADVDSVPAHWWRDDPAAHLLAPVDVARRADGHDAVLPWCVVTVGAYLRARAEEPLSGGEAVTLAVSLMRGCAEAALPARFGDEQVAVPHGRWWLTDHGRPLFAIGEGTPAREETAELLTMLAGSCADRVVARLATEAADSIRVRSPVTVLVRLEESMFEACAPRPLVVRVADPVALRPLEARELRARDDEARDMPTTRFIGAGRGEESRRGATPWPDALRSAVHNLMTSRERRSEPRTRSRRTPVLLGVSVAVVILIVGLLWPQPDDDNGGGVAAVSSSPSVADTGDGAGVAAGGSQPPAPVPDQEEPDDAATTMPTAPAEPQLGDTSETLETGEVPAPAPSDAAGPSSNREAEIVATTAALLAAVAACTEQDDCRSLVADGVDAAQIPTGGAIELIEDFGGVAVLRVVADAGATSLLSIERLDGAWRVREVTAMIGKVSAICSTWPRRRTARGG